ncbi:hypothetical protein L218DRAFT_1072986 [Marasmius fiardii PR-910]|nr:hypothetical protein L218DRAFT_1072986 [Marasmius fiardii PR-910]
MVVNTTLRRDNEFYFDTITFQVDDTIFKVPSQYIHEKSEVFDAGAQISAESDEGSSDANPVKLSPLPHGCNANDFRCLLRIIIALTVGLPTPTNYNSDQWLSVLKLSTAWYFSDIRKLANEQISRPQVNYTKDQWVKVLDFAHNSDQFTDLRDLAITRISAIRFNSRVDQVLLGRKYLHKPWIIEGLKELANMSSLPSVAELNRLGQGTVVSLLYMAYNRVQSMVATPNRSQGYYTYPTVSDSGRGPYSDREVEEQFRDEISSLFPRPPSIVVSRRSKSYK